MGALWLSCAPRELTRRALGARAPDVMDEMARDGCDEMDGCAELRWAATYGSSAGGPPRPTPSSAARRRVAHKGWVGGIRTRCTHWST